MKIRHVFHNTSRAQRFLAADGLLLCIAGLSLIFVPDPVSAWFPKQAWASPAALRGFGFAFLLASAFAGIVARAADQRTIHRGLLVLTAAHLLFAFVLTVDHIPYGTIELSPGVQMGYGFCQDPEHCGPWFGSLGLGLQHPWFAQFSWIAALTAAVVLFTTLRSRGSQMNLRSAWEQSIRDAAGQEERNRLARDLHDSIKQQIFAIQTSVAAAQVRLANGSEGANAALEDARQSAREATVEMETLLDQLQAAPLENQGLVASVRKQAEALGFRTGAKVNVEIDWLPPSEALPPGAQQAIHRILQETLANVAKHARATVVDIRLGRDSNGDLTMRVHDNGQGFNVADPKRGMGLRNLMSRAKEVGGVVAIQSKPGSGTTIEVCVPLTERSHFITAPNVFAWSSLLVPMFAGFTMRTILITLALLMFSHLMRIFARRRRERQELVQ